MQERLLRPCLTFSFYLTGIGIHAYGATKLHSTPHAREITQPPYRAKGDTLIQKALGVGYSNAANTGILHLRLWTDQDEHNGYMVYFSQALSSEYHSKSHHSSMVTSLACLTGRAHDCQATRLAAEHSSPPANKVQCQLGTDRHGLLMLKCVKLGGY